MTDPVTSLATIDLEGLDKEETGGQIRAQVERILRVPDFERSERLRDFLVYIVDEALAGRVDRLKGYTVAVDVFGRDADFDPQTDSVVRIYAGRLRRALERYYFKQGAADPIRVDVPKGAYEPVFSLQRPVAPSERVAFVDEAFYEVPAGPAVAVLPFRDLSEGGGDEYFATGLATEVASRLARFQEFQVLGPQTGAFISTHAGNQVLMARQVGARFILEATVHRTAERVRIVAHLTDTQNGIQVWTNTYEEDGSPGDMLRDQKEMADKVANEIGDPYGFIPRRLSREVRERETNHPKALEAILRFNYHQAIGAPLSHSEAMTVLLEAAAADPDDAMVLACLSEHLIDDSKLMYLTVEDAESRAWEMAKKAVALESRLQRAQWAKAYAHLHRREFEQFFEHAEKALDLNPNAAYMVGLTGWAIALAGKWERGLAIMEKGMELNPHYPAFFHHAPCLYALKEGDLQEALCQARAFNMPGFPWDPLHRTSIMGLLGRETHARRALTELLNIDPEFGSYARQYVSGFVFQEELVDTIVDGLEKAGLEVEA